MSKAPAPDGGPESSRATSKADESWIGTTASRVLERARSFRDTASFLLDQPQRLQERARDRHRELHERTVSEHLRALRLPKLREFSPGLRLGDLGNTGLSSVLHVVSCSAQELQQHPGVGQKTAEQAVFAARRIAESVREGTVVRLSPDGTNPVQTQLLGDLRAVEHAEQVIAELGFDPNALMAEADALARRTRRDRSWTQTFLSRKRRKDEARTALGELDALLADARVQNTYASAESVRSAAESQAPDDLWGTTGSAPTSTTCCWRASRVPAHRSTVPGAGRSRPRWSESEPPERGTASASRQKRRAERKNRPARRLGYACPSSRSPSTCR